MDGIPQKFLVENCSVNVEYLEIRTREITAGAYLIPISEIVNGVQQIRVGALLIVNNYILGLIWRNDSIYLFDSHSKDKKDCWYSCYSSSKIWYVALTGKLFKISLLQYFPSDFIFSSAFYKSWQYFQCQKCHEKWTKKVAVVSKSGEKYAREKIKYHGNPEKEKTFKKGYHNKN